MGSLQDQDPGALSHRGLHCIQPCYPTHTDVAATNPERTVLDLRAPSPSLTASLPPPSICYMPLGQAAPCPSPALKSSVAPHHLKKKSGSYAACQVLCDPNPLPSAATPPQVLPCTLLLGNSRPGSHHPATSTQKGARSSLPIQSLQSYSHNPNVSMSSRVIRGLNFKIQSFQTPCPIPVQCPSDPPGG